MKTLMLAISVVGLLFAGSAMAIDGGALCVDTLAVQGASYDDSGSVGGLLESEVAVRTPGADWSVVAGVSYANIDPDWRSDDLTAIGGELGVKYYITKYCSIGLIGTYEEYDSLGKSDVVGGWLRLKHRFTAARSGVSPYLNAAVGIRASDYEVGSGSSINSNNDNDTGVLAGFGCDFMLTEDLAIVFEGAYSAIIETSSGSDDDISDGFTGRIGLVGYWD